MTSKDVPIKCDEAATTFSMSAEAFAAIVTENPHNATKICRSVAGQGCVECNGFFSYNICAIVAMFLKRLEEQHPELGRTIDREFELMLETCETLYNEIK